jgi:ABC-type transporter MlaC component
MKRTFILLIFVAMVLSVAAVSAADNATDAVAETADLPLSDVQEDIPLEAEDSPSDALEAEQSQEIGQDNATAAPTKR